MIISNSLITMTGRSMYSESYKKKETLEVWADPQKISGNMNLQNTDIWNCLSKAKLFKAVFPA